MERIRVPFKGEGAGTGRLAWGQRQVPDPLLALRGGADLGMLYNDRRPALGGTGRPASREAIRAALPLTRLVREVPMRFFNEQLMINVDAVPDVVQITTEVDTHHLAVEDLRALLSEMESFTVEAALAV